MAEFDFATLVTNRSQADLDTLRALLAVPLADWTAGQLAEFNQAISKGSYNYTDLNRVTACMDYLNEVLTGLGYETGYHGIIIHPNGAEPTLWCEEDVPTPTQMQRYLYNVEALRGVLELPEDTAPVPADMVGLTTEEANAIEDILVSVEVWIRNMMQAWFYSGEIYSGEA